MLISKPVDGPVTDPFHAPVFDPALDSVPYTLRIHMPVGKPVSSDT